ncbi:MAG: Sulfurtransferase [Acidimicrobiales bacterium]|nr:Sulfurtransferase [Acidimicrobiales bacterium]
MEVPEIGVEEVGGTGDDFTVIDVRNPDEYVEAHVPGVTLIPLSELADRIAEVPTDRRVYVICRSGLRSETAARYMIEHGIDATNVAGGMLAWIDAGKAVEAGPG